VVSGRHGRHAASDVIGPAGTAGAPLLMTWEPPAFSDRMEPVIRRCGIRSRQSAPYLETPRDLAIRKEVEADVSCNRNLEGLAGSGVARPVCRSST